MATRERKPTKVSLLQHKMASLACMLAGSDTLAGRGSPRLERGGAEIFTEILDDMLENERQPVSACLQAQTLWLAAAVPEWSGEDRKLSQRS